MQRPLLVLLPLLLITSCREEQAGRAASITVFAAASTADVVADLAAHFEAERGIDVKLSFGASSTLARQIAGGAEADVFISAHPQWMDYLGERELIDPATRRNLLSNRLVLIAPRESALRVDVDESFDISSTGIERIAAGDPAHVPAGIYARQALQRLRWMDEVEDLLIPCPDVRAALRLVEMGEADLGIVYASDAHASEKVKVIAVPAPELHDPIIYPIALIANAGSSAHEFLSFLSTDNAAATIERHGFDPPPP